MALAPATAFADRFELLGELGRGSSSVVHRARDRETGVVVALKLPVAAADERARARLRREAKVLARASGHPNVVTFRGSGEHEGTPYVVMELVVGQSLAQRLAEGSPFPCDEACTIAWKIASGVEHVHLWNVVHRHLEPSTVLVDAASEPRIMGFGLAIEAGSAGDEAVPFSAFAAPEELRQTRDDIGPAADVYGIGAVLYAMLAGRAPHLDGERDRLLAAIESGPPPLPDGVPARIVAICRRALSPRPTDRHETAAALEKDLLEALRSGGRTSAYLQVGAFGRYEALSIVGRGGMGVVHRGRAPDGRAVAIKVLHRRDADAVGRFERERQLLAELGEDEGFVPLLDSGQGPLGPYIVMPFLEGGSLRDRLDAGPLPVAEVESLARALAAALGAAHSRGVIHRDLKPENVLFRSSESGAAPVVCDLGLAKHFEADGRGTSASIVLSKTGLALGTFGYASPEQLADAKHAGPRTDVFALGAILYECLAGKPVFQARTLEELLRKVRAGTIEPLARLRPEAPRRLREAIDRALSPDPGRRWKDGGELADALGDDTASRTTMKRRAVPRSPDEAFPSTPAGASPPLPARPWRARFGSCETVAEIGRGGAGTVFSGRASDGRAVAIKVLHRRDAETVARFGRERRVLASFGATEGFVPLLDAGESPHGPYLVMPLLAGGTLRARLDRGKLGVAEACDLVRTLARALGKAHERGIVHRDVKPENILFGDDGTPLVADLGLAKHFRTDAPGASQSVAISRSLVMRGSAGYMSREQMLDAKNVGPAADVFALGAILYECLAGRPAFLGESFLHVVQKVEAGELEPLATFRPETPRWLQGVVSRCLSPEPLERFPHGEALARSLEGSARARRVAAALLSRAGEHGPAIVVSLVLLALVGGGAALVLPNREAAIDSPASADGPAPAVARTGSETERASRELPRTSPTPQASSVAPLASRAATREPGSRGVSAAPAPTRPARPPRPQRFDEGKWTGRVMEARTLAERTERLKESRKEKGEAEEALFAWEIDNDPKAPWYWEGRGVARLARGDFVGAISDCSKALEILPGSVGAMRARGLARTATGDHDAAIEDLDKLIELGRLDARSWSARGAAYLASGDLDRALADFDKALSLDTPDKCAYTDRAIARRKKGDRAGALADLQQAIQGGDPATFESGTEAFRQLGLLYLESKELKEQEIASEYFSMFLARAPTDDPNAPAVRAVVDEIRSRLSTQHVK